MAHVRWRCQCGASCLTPTWRVQWQCCTAAGASPRKLEDEWKRIIGDRNTLLARDTLIAQHPHDRHAGCGGCSSATGASQRLLTQSDVIGGSNSQRTQRKQHIRLLFTCQFPAHFPSSNERNLCLRSIDPEVSTRGQSTIVQSNALPPFRSHKGFGPFADAGSTLVDRSYFQPTRMQLDLNISNGLVRIRVCSCDFAH